VDFYPCLIILLTNRYIFGWYDARNSSNSTGLQYMGAQLNSATLTAIVNGTLTLGGITTSD